MPWPLRQRSSLAQGAGQGGALELLQALEQIRPLNRRILILRFVAGYSNREIADQLAMQEKTVSKRIERALRLLQSKLGQE